MKGLRIRRNGNKNVVASSTGGIRTLRISPPPPQQQGGDDHDALMLPPIEEHETPMEGAGAAAAFADLEAMERHRRLKSLSLASLTTWTTESTSSMHSVFEEMAEEEAAAAATGANDDEEEEQEGGGGSALRPGNRRGRRQSRGGCLRVKTQEESLQRKFTASKAPGPRSRAASHAAADKGRTEAEGKTVVQFSHITVHSHQHILGDNPTPATGPPLSIEWTAFDSMTVPLDEYEGNRERPPRPHSELQTSGGLRTAWLLQAGHTLEEIATVEKNIRAIQRKRMASLSSHEHNPAAKANVPGTGMVAKLLPRAWARRKNSNHNNDAAAGKETEKVVYMWGVPYKEHEGRWVQVKQ
jgi:hypothetical protein